ncbi:MAG: hypothetical protein AAGC46_14215 [Solirubrobacteraceae bacterium]|nr:hypothetical protein [Patulibacter sp.]
MAIERKLPEVGEEIHLPGPSAQPLLVAVFSTVTLLGVTQPHPIFFIIGAVGLLLTLFSWIRDAVHEFKALPESHGDHGHAPAHAAPAATPADTPADSH